MCSLSLFGLAGAAGATEPASAPDGCTFDTSVPNAATLACAPGSGVGQHAFIRCRDTGGVLHTRVGITLGTEGGSSRAVCADGETGPA
ncbi:hypothetical protein IU452_26030 [Nocardia transvalensis]|nr:hypothetical protein [Nocardia transvalensis]